MANPAPTINQINAFNATQGTTIDFNIIGGTELVRSNRIYIYDLSDNSLICTHLYVSTESIHELPPNTDGSIVYEDGKSSADFVNGAQYYAQIQTFTDIAGTEGGSGLSVAKMFWCLVAPTLTITTIPSTISTTSYNVSATYDANTSVVSNIIQQYQFSLYSATGSLLQSSGVVVGSGTQQGTSTTYDISYNFTGLSVGSSYYVVVDVTTTQGMSVSAQSGTFTVSIDTPTLGEATVVNNACDGYISVTSNLSSEYGGSGSGEIVSFETDSENVFTKLQVDLDPIQDLNGYDAPWVGGAGKNKLPLTVDGIKALNTGWSWSGNAATLNGVTCTLVTDSQGTITAINVNGTASSNTDLRIGGTFGSTTVFATSGSYTVSGNSTNTVLLAGYGSTALLNTSSITTASCSDGVSWFFIRVQNGKSPTNEKVYPMICLSTATNPTTFEPYENICPISGWDEVGVSVVGVNWSPLGSVTSYLNGGVPSNQNKIYENIVQGKTYTLSFDILVAQNSSLAVGNRLGVWLNDTGSSLIRPDLSATGHKTVTFTATANGFINFWAGSGAYSNNTKVIDNIQLEEGSSETPYQPYTKTDYTTTLPSTTYGGTLDVVSGVLTVTHGYLDLGTKTWTYYTSGTNPIFYSSVSDAKRYARGDTINAISTNYPVGYVATTRTVLSQQLPDKSFAWIELGGALTIRDSSYTSASDFKTAMSGVYVCYELATPQTYQLTPQQIQTLVGKNNVWSENGEIELSYHIPITNLLVKRQDVADVSGDWLTLYSQPITQASDMDFTFIDFTNQYGKTYKYALVPLLTQTQSGVEVEVEGGYTVSDEVQSVFDGVFIVDSTGSQKCKANVGYGNVDMNQAVGTITPIGAKYPVVITNSKNQYHNGSIYGTIVPDDYYFNGNLSRIDMVNKRDELEQFLTNKRAKIIKDWNGKIWLVMIMDNVSCTFNNNYGMGIVNFSTNWVEVGDPTNQQDLQATGLINVGGV